MMKATGRVIGRATTIGELTRFRRATASVGVTASCRDISTSKQPTSYGGRGAVGETTRELQTVASYIGIYAN